jgi:hypothetical protein
VPPIVKYSLLCIQKDSMKYCNAKIIARKTIRGILSPCDDGLRFDLKGFAPIHHKFWFCANDLICCVRGIGRKYCVNWPFVMRSQVPS